MKGLIRLATASTLVCALAALTACGGSDDKEHDAGGGGTLTMLAGSDVDFLDPGHTYYATGVMVALATQRPLYGFAPGDLSHPKPDMAAAPPVVSADGLTVTIRLRRGVRFSPPVDREVTSRDVAYAFERFFSANVGGPYTGYFSALVGAPAKPTNGVRRIRGIETPDTHTIVFHLTRRSPATFLGALSLPASAPVPEEYAKRFDASNPSTYNTHVVATGPYMVRNDRAGNAVGYQPGRLIELVRNPNWRRSTDDRPAALDAIRIRTNATDTSVAARQVIAGSHMVMDGPPPPSILKRVVQGAGDTSARISQGGYRFLPINTTIEPFDNVNVRKALLASFDRAAVRLARGGAATGPLATHFLPPGIAGYEEAGGQAGPGYDFLSAANAGGDPALAERYMQQAGYPSGKYTGKEKFLLVSGNTDGDAAVAEVVQAQFAKLGFRTRLRFVPTDALFTDWCSVPAKEVLSCASSIAWLKDFPDPEPMLRPVFDGNAISKPTDNTNYSQLDDARLNAAMAEAATLTGGARAKAWGAIDRQILADAPAVPLQWDVMTLIRSKDVKGVPNVYFDSWDLSYTSLK
ncbi:MAG TPA: ABC transporter substrate-binding protein [Baekduia sp.]|nr:ABC transporter substrate-binding protein [Baekduia sp.]